MKEIEEIAKMQTALKYIEKTLADIKTVSDDLTLKQHEMIKDIWELKNKIPNIQKSLDEIEDKQQKSTIGYFIKNNWFRLTSFILGISIILGAVGDFLYRLPPPIKK